MSRAIVKMKKYAKNRFYAFILYIYAFYKENIHKKIKVFINKGIKKFDKEKKWVYNNRIK